MTMIYIAGAKIDADGAEIETGRLWAVSEERDQARRLDYGRIVFETRDGTSISFATDPDEARALAAVHAVCEGSVEHITALRLWLFDAERRLEVGV